MGESQPHIEALRALLDAVDDLFWDADDVSVHGNVHWYWKEGDATQTRVPDLMVIPEVQMDHDRRSFKSWEHGGRVPSAIIETASHKTYRANLAEVKDDYEANGVREYFVFDATPYYLPVPLVGFRLSRGRYREIRRDSDGSMISRELNVRLRPEGRILRLIDLKTSEPRPTRPERIAFYEARHQAHLIRIAESEAQVAKRDVELAKRDVELAEREETIRRLNELLRKAGIDPNLGKGK